MLATLGTLPSGSGWAYEMKWDESTRVRGFLMVFSLEPVRGEVRLR
jgi:hypothetical protein